MTTAYSEEVRQEAVRLYRSGMTAKQVAAQMGISTGTVWNCCKEAGVEKRRAGSHSPHTAEIKTTALKLYADGMSVIKVGAAIDIAPATVWLWCRDAGVIRPSLQMPYPTEIRDKVVRLHKAGWPASEIANLMKIHRNTIGNWLNKHGREDRKASKAGWQRREWQKQRAVS